MMSEELESKGSSSAKAWIEGGVLKGGGGVLYGVQTCCWFRPRPQAQQ